MADQQTADATAPVRRTPAGGDLLTRLNAILGDGRVRALLNMRRDPAALNAYVGDYSNRSHLVHAILLANRTASVPNDAAAAPNAIPRHIVQFWHAPTPPEDVARLVAGWAARNPGYRHTLFCDDTARAFIETEYGDDARQIYDCCPHPVLRCDLFRYLYLYRKGGIYIDADEECLAPLAPDFGAGYDLVLAARAWRFGEKRDIHPETALGQDLGPDKCCFYINNAPIACQPGLTLFEHVTATALRAIRAELAAGRAPQVQQATEPQIFTAAVIRSILGAADPLARISATRWMTDWYGRQVAERGLAYKNTEANWREPAPTAGKPLSLPRYQVFADIFRKKSWGAGSGPGSTPSVTAEYRLFLERFIALNDIRSVLDIGCGDWQFSRFVNFAPATYLGLDAVPELIEANRKHFAGKTVEFAVMPEQMADVPGADLILIKDVLQHLPNAEIEEFRSAVLPKCRFALITNSFSKGDAPRNTDIAMGGFRCLDLTHPPYGFPGAYVLELHGTGERLRTLLVEGGAAR